MIFVPHRAHIRSSIAWYWDSFTFLYVADIGISQETHTDLHGLLPGKLYYHFLIFYRGMRNDILKGVDIIVPAYHEGV
jgi:hypothetical protein